MQERKDTDNDICIKLYNMQNKNDAYLPIFLNDSEMKHFKDLNKDELEVFLLCRDKSIATKSKLPNKGKLKDAQNGEKNLIFLAFQLRGKASILDTIPVPEETNENQTGDDAPSLVHTIIDVPLNADSEECILPSSILSKPEWINNVVKVFDGEDCLIKREINEEANKEADVLVEVLQVRFKQHVQRRIKEN